MSWSTSVAQAPLPEHWMADASSTWDSVSDVAKDAALLGQICMGGCPFHVRAIRVVVDAAGIQRAVDPAYESQLERLFAIGDDARLVTAAIPGHDGEYVIVVFPHAD